MSGLKIQDLFVESRKYPLGVDAHKPSFGWSFQETRRRGAGQSAYRIIVTTSVDNLAANVGDMWDSGVIGSARCTHVTYDGKPLRSSCRYYWKVIVWDDAHVQTESTVSWWETGLLRSEDWVGQWIQAPRDADAAATQFRHEFTLESSIVRARAFVCGLGQYELYVNGNRVGDSVLNPGWTNYDKTRLYNVFDVSTKLSHGANAIGILLANGFFHVAGGRYSKFKASFGTPKCIVQLQVEFIDGSKMTIASNGNWKCSPSPIVFSEVYGGEDYDARLEQTGWSRPGFNAVHWLNAFEENDSKAVLKSQSIPPVKVMERFSPVDITETRPGIYVVDFGQNFSGWVNVVVRGKAGEELVLTPSEVIQDGLANQRHSGSPYKWQYTLKGTEKEVWAPRFSYYGFRYVQVEGLVPSRFAGEQNGTGSMLSIEGEMIYPDIDVKGEFQSSDPMMNRVHEIINWSVLSNMKSVFTDCPHREKLGWLEQTHLLGPAVMFNYDVESLLCKVVNDIRDAQLPNGLVPSTAPEYTVFEGTYHHFRDTVAWGIAYILLPWFLNQKYGNHSILSEHYEGMKKYVEYVSDQSDNFIVTGGLGDWYDVGENPPGYAQNTPVELVETAMFYHMVEVLGQVAASLGHSADCNRYEALKQSIYAAFQKAFVHTHPFVIGTDSQTSNAIPLVLGLLSDYQQGHALKHLAADIERTGYRITAGDIGHRFVLLALANHGFSHIIQQMVQQTDEPGYGYQVIHGATTLTEAWGGPKIGNSQNHFMLGHIEEWFYRNVAGIDYYFDKKSEQFHIDVRPEPGSHLGWVRAYHTLRPGTVSIDYKEHWEDQISLKVQIPANTTAVIHIPADSRAQVLERGMPLAETEGLSFIKMEGPYAVVSVGSGEYYFTSVKHEQRRMTSERA
ncbi:family 78 glycoside hydrolase catalytic domain [Alicyclobacillus sp. SO9]|uniref:family 78 glycoside hydrolase catalytic domain n=1 Tax=Alicyclobacillus sp. SO9 TaxID=2665646 RepID=UPI0018E6E39A|nr:family 78 glycoside hydrolase catalytic domain [Alicyclobacillus sp. SO9]QQE77968.1 family 78 glycoside hydrolase catalytic domain [Alicyclobacillus sp. SO9]